jgi:DNA end-binding protein Ku
MGLLNVPVQMMTAIDNHDRRASMYHHHSDDSYAPVKMPKVCSGCAKTVSQSDTVSGYEWEGEIVILTDADKAAIAKNAGQSMEVLRFVYAKQVNPMLFSGEKLYYILPDENPKRGGKQAIQAYKAILQVLAEEDKVAVVSYIKWNKNRIALLRVEPTEDGGVLVLQNLLWSDELRSPQFEVLTKARDTEVNPRLLPVARAAIESMTEDWNPADYVDVYEEQLTKAIAAKAAGQEITVVETEAAPAPDDMDALIAKLQASVKPKAPAKKAARKKVVA